MLNFLKKLFSGGNASATYFNLSPSEFEQKMAQNTERVVLDVRTVDEFKGGHLPKAINANVMNSELLSKAAQLDKNKPVFVYCRSGARSARACSILAGQGFTELYNMSGGISSWMGKVVK